MKKCSLLLFIIVPVLLCFSSSSFGEPKTVLRAYAGPLFHMANLPENSLDSGNPFGLEAIWDINIKPTYSLEVAVGFAFYTDDFRGLVLVPSPTVPGTTILAPLTVDFDSLFVTLSLRNKFKLNERLFFTIGGGVGSYFSDQKSVISGIRSSDIDGESFGVHFLSGLDVKLTEHFFLMGEFRYTLARLEYLDIASMTKENMDFITLYFGIGVRL